MQEKSYRPTTVKRVEIDKPDGGKRKLGIPTVRDRVVQQAVRSILEPIFDKDFHPSSYGYRKGRSCHHAISKAQLFIRKYKTILNLIRLFLESGVMVSGKYESSDIGSPQGGVISPLLANIYLDKFDQFMMSRKHRIVRYADDILILCGSEKSAQNAQRVAEEFLENELKLTVNRDKTHILIVAKE